tara:strand:+ start:2015 stop:2875 length:861 start_codon:yes stop_codon:yes gene_type:complete
MKTSVHILLGSKNLDFSIECLSSFVKYCKSNYEILIHEDGTINEENRITIRKSLLRVNFISPNVAEMKIIPKLQKYRKCYDLWQNNIHFKKYINSLFFRDDSVQTLILDSDILFYRFFELPALKSKQVLFIKDKFSSYSIKALHLKPFGSIKIKSKLNVGMVFFKNNMLKLDYIEEFLRDYDSDLKRRIYFIEQTIWALIASNFYHPHYISSSQIFNASKQINFNPKKTVAIHFVGTYRDQYKIAKKFKAIKNIDTVVLKLVKTKRLNYFLFVIDRLYFKFSKKIS